MKKAVVNVVSLALAILALLSCATGCMEFFEEKSYFGLSETAGLLFAFIFSFLVCAFSYRGFKEFLFDILDKDKKK